MIFIQRMQNISILFIYSGNGGLVDGKLGDLGQEGEEYAKLLKK